MSSAQQKPKGALSRGTRNSARMNGKAFKKTTAAPKPSFNSCLGISVQRLISRAGGVSKLYDEVNALYQKAAKKRGWSPTQADAKASDWMSGYTLRQREKRDRMLVEAKLIEES